MSKIVYIPVKNTAKNANHYLNIQPVVIFLQQHQKSLITDHHNK